MAKLLTVREVSALLGKDQSTIRVWGRTGVLALNVESYDRGRGVMLFSLSALFNPLLPPCPKANFKALGALQSVAALNDRANRLAS